MDEAPDTTNLTDRKAENNCVFGSWPSHLLFLIDCWTQEHNAAQLVGNKIFGKQQKQTRQWGWTCAKKAACVGPVDCNPLSLLMVGALAVGFDDELFCHGMMKHMGNMYLLLISYHLGKLTFTQTDGWTRGKEDSCHEKHLFLLLFHLRCVKSH